MKITDLLGKSVRLNQSASSKEEVLKMMVDLMSEKGNISLNNIKSDDNAEISAPKIRPFLFICIPQSLEADKRSITDINKLTASSLST